MFARARTCVHVYRCFPILYFCRGVLVEGGQNMDSSLAPTDVAAFLGRWRVHGVHGLHGAALTRAHITREQDVGIGDVFDVMQVEGTVLHAVAMRAGGAVLVDSAAAASRLRLNACLRSTFVKTSAVSHLLSGSRRTKNAESRRRTSSTV